MLLKIVVLLGLAVYFSGQSAWLLAAVSVAALIPVAGLPIVIGLAVYLLVRGQFVPAGILGGLIVLNLVGNQLVGRGTERRRLPDPHQSLLDYCRGYLAVECGMDDESAQLAVLDPELGPEMDRAVEEWAAGLPSGTDPAAVLARREYSSTRMSEIDALLDASAARFKERRPLIVSYLRERGHPIAPTD